MHPSSEPVLAADWHTPPENNAPEENAWLRQARRFSFVRIHIGFFAVGSVALLAFNLLLGSSGIWADSWIVSWALVLVMHMVIAGIASLALQLMEDDDIRPASEIRWDPMRTWQTPKSNTVSETPEPVLSAWRARSGPVKPAMPESDEPKGDDKVSWKTATDAAWLARPDGTRPDEPGPAAPPSSGDDSAGQSHVDRYV